MIFLEIGKKKKNDINSNIVQNDEMQKFKIFVFFSFSTNIKCISCVRTLLIDRDEESFNNVTYYMSLFHCM